MGVCRSLLFVPASKPAIFPKALASGADIVCANLEDAIGALEKDVARRGAIEFLCAGNGTRRALRINSLRSRVGLQDVLAVQEAASADGTLVLPQAEAAEEIRWIEELLRGLPGIRFAALI